MKSSRPPQDEEFVPAKISIRGKNNGRIYRPPQESNGGAADEELVPAKFSTGGQNNGGRRGSMSVAQLDGSGGRSLLAGSIESFAHLFRNQPSAKALIEKGDDAVEAGDDEEALNNYNKALERERQSASGDSIQAASILHKIGLTLARTGDSFAAMNSFEEALKIRQERLGPGSEDAAETTKQMLKILDEIRQQSGVGERKFILGDCGSVTSFDDTNNVSLGTNLLEWGEYQEAETVLKKCLQTINDGGDEYKNTDEKIKVLEAVAELDRAQGKYDEAKEMYLEVLKTAKKMSTVSNEEVDISIINSIAGYAEILRKAGDLWQAEALHRKVRNMLIHHAKHSEDTDTETDLNLAVSHTQLGCTVFALEKYDDALQEHQSALKIRLRLLEITDALVSESFNYCAETLCAMGREAEALPLSLQAVDIRAREFGDKHPAYAHALCILSKCYHGLDRSRDAMPLIEKCLEICQSVFSENHANIIPNLIVKGDILRAVGELEKSLSTYQRAESIHNANFKEGQRKFQLEECKKKIADVKAALKDEVGSCASQSIKNGENKISGGTPVIVITDIGRDVDDALAIVLLASLKKMFILNPLAVITTLNPDEDRACLARAILDSLAMEDVPVGIGTDVAGPEEEIALHCFTGVTALKPFHFERGGTLISRVLAKSEYKSVKLLCIASLRDVSELIVKQQQLFRTKIKEVIFMGGAQYSESRQQLIPDETAFNNSCDPVAARHVYAECQQNGIPTTSVSRIAAYGCPLSVSFLDGLQDAKHLLAGDIRSANFKAMQQLWKKVNMPAWMPGRGKLPARCNRQWFIDFFHVNVDDETYTCQDIWKHASLFLYDSLAMLSCVDAYADLHFTPKRYLVDGTPHRLIGLSEEGVSISGVANKDDLANELNCLIHQALRLSLEGMDRTPNKNDRSEDSDDKEASGVECDEKKTADDVEPNVEPTAEPESVDREWNMHASGRAGGN